MILAADRNGCVREVLIIAAALSIQDPRERPADAQQAADEAHRRFADPDSDFAAYLKLWDYLAERQAELSSSAFRRMCRAEYLNYLRVREWQDLQGQLQRLAGDLKVSVRSSSAERSAGSPVPASWPALPDRHEGRARPLDPRRRAQAGGGRAPSTSARATPGSPSSPGPAWPGRRRTGSWPPSWSRPPGCGPASWRASTRTGSSRWPPTWSGAVTASRTGSASGAAPSRWRRSPCTACPSWPTARSATGASTRSPRASCSSGTPWSKATGRPATGSSPRTGGCWTRRPRWSTGPAAAAWSSARTSWPPSTTRASRPRWSRPSTSTPGGSRPAGPTPTCSRSRRTTCSPTTRPGSPPSPTRTSGPRSRRACPSCRCPTPSSPAATPTA